MSSGRWGVRRSLLLARWSTLLERAPKLGDEGTANRPETSRSQCGIAWFFVGETPTCRKGNKKNAALDVLRAAKAHERLCRPSRAARTPRAKCGFRHSANVNN